MLSQLRLVVVDEAHAYHGVFGSHVALVLRRLRRLCALHGARPTFVCCSATVASPLEHMALLTGLPRRRLRVAPDRPVSSAPHGLRSLGEGSKRSDRRF